MTNRFGWLIASAALSALVACGGGSGPEPVTPECTTHEQCAAGKYCSDAGTCVDLSAGACRKEADCSATQNCVNQVCVAQASCTTHDQCPAQQYCGSGSACVPETNPGVSCHKTADCNTSTQTCQANVCTASGDECAKTNNAARKAALLAAQPALAVKAGTGKMVKTLPKTWTSLDGDTTKTCSVDLQFKDLNNDGALQPYEDWSLTAAERAADLAGRMTDAQKAALVLHPVFSDVPSGAGTPSAATLALVDAGVRFGQTAATTAQLTPRAAWANAIQERAEAAALGIPFVLSAAPAHSAVGGRTVAKGYSQWPSELGLGATGDVAAVKNYGAVVSKEFRAIGVRMALGVSANLATEPRWWGTQFSFGEDSATVADMVDAFVNGLQGDSLSSTGVAAVVGDFPGAGAAKGGFDARFSKGKFLSFSGTHFDDHVNAFKKAIARGSAAVMPSYGVPEAGAWTGQGGVAGASIEQVGASFSSKLLTDLLRGTLSFSGLVVAPAGVLEDAGLAPLGAPWGVEGLTKAQRVKKAVDAGADQFVGLSDAATVTAAGLSAAQLDASAKRALAVTFRLGLFENPYVDAAAAPTLCATESANNAALDATNSAMVLVVNKQKPTGWLNGTGDGNQTGDKGNAGNGTQKILPAPPGAPYIAAGCDYYIAGDFDPDYVNSVSTGYGNMTNDAPIVKGVPTTTPAARMALSDYIFIRIAAPYLADADTGTFAYGIPSLSYAANDATVLAPVQAARAAISAWTGPPASQTQIVVFVDGGRPSVLGELTGAPNAVSGLYVDWMGLTPPKITDKVALDVAFGIVNGRGKLPVSLPASESAAGSQLPDVAGDGADATFVRTFGIDTNRYE